MRRFRGGYNIPNNQNPALNQAFIEDEEENSQNQNQQNVEMQNLQEQFQNLQVNPDQNLEPIQPVQEEGNLPQYVNNVQFEPHYGGKRHRTYIKKNRKTRKHRKNRKSLRKRY